MISIIIIEDNIHFNKALKQIIDTIPDAELIGCYVNGESAIAQIAGLQPMIVLVDIQLEGKLTGLDVIKHVKPVCPGAEFLVCTVHDDSSYVFDALRSGASGYILKTADSNEIKNAILEVASGGAPMSPFIARKVIGSFTTSKPRIDDSDNSLTKREKEVLNLIAKGLLYKEIAEILCVSYSTVKKHLKNIYQKLHVQNKIEALNKFRLS